MASIANDPGGRRRIQFVDVDGTRRTIRLGKVAARTAEQVKFRVEQLLTAKIAQVAVDPDTARWIAELPEPLAKKLSRARLISRHGTTPVKLGPFLKAYRESRKDVKPATQEIWQQTERNLTDFFGAERELDSINEGDADEFKLHLVAEQLAPTTVHKRLQFARMFFRVAVRRKHIASNPFAEVSATAAVSADRHFFVTRKDVEHLLKECDPNWEAIVALGRYGGLRCPSEVLSLRWKDIDWQAGKITVRSPKTEHLPGKESREIPLFPELRTSLLKAHSSPSRDPEYVVSGNYRKQADTDKGWRNCNLRTQFERIIKRAGLKPWPRLFHALRASRETELAAEYPLHVVTKWLGNTPKIAMKHYLQVTQADFARAAGHVAAVDSSPAEKPECAPVNAPLPLELPNFSGFSEEFATCPLRFMAFPPFGIESQSDA